MLPTTKNISITPLTAPIQSTVQPPGSKSLTNRALLLAALAQGESLLRDPLWADDPHQMVNALKALGFDLRIENNGRLVRLRGLGGAFPTTSSREPVRLQLGNAGTAYRFLTAACCLGEGVHELDGIPRMRQRPIGQLVEPLRQLGANIEHLDQQGFPPLRVTGAGKSGLRGGTIAMSPTLSSQYISALLQIGPLCCEGLTLKFDGPVTSKPYVEMTLNLMARFGVQSQVDANFTQVRVEPGQYRGTDYPVEPDASSASYFLAAGAIVPGSRVTVQGLGQGSLQGDVGFADVLHQMGAGLAFGKDFITIIAPPPETPLRGIDIDLNHMPDMAQTLAIVALFARGPTTIRNVGNLRVKETDRIEALRVELTKLGATVEIEGDDIFIEPPANGQIKPAAIDTYNDHRMAMSFAVAGLRSAGITINDPSCVDKTFPEFFEYLQRLGKAPVAP